MRWKTARGKRYRPVTVYMDTRLYRALSSRCRKVGVSRSLFIRAALTRSLGEGETTVERGR